MPAVKKQYGLYGLAYPDVTWPIMKVSFLLLYDSTVLLPISIVCVVAAVGLSRYAPVKRRIGALLVQFLAVLLILAIAVMFASAIIAERKLVEGLSGGGIRHVGVITGE